MRPRRPHTKANPNPPDSAIPNIPRPRFLVDEPQRSELPTWKLYLLQRYELWLFNQCPVIALNIAALHRMHRDLSDEFIDHLDDAVRLIRHLPSWKETDPCSPERNP